MEKNDYKEIAKWAFVYVAVLIISLSCYTAGLLSGAFGNGNFKALLFATLPLALFFLGRWFEKYKNYNHL